LGCETRRKAPHPLNVTFIDKEDARGAVRTKEKPHFGRVISFAGRELYVKWAAAMLVAEHGRHVRPPPILALNS